MMLQKEGFCIDIAFAVDEFDILGFPLNTPSFPLWNIPDSCTVRWVMKPCIFFSSETE